MFPPDFAELSEDELRRFLNDPQAFEKRARVEVRCLLRALGEGRLSRDEWLAATMFWVGNVASDRLMIRGDAAPKLSPGLRPAESWGRLVAKVLSEFGVHPLARRDPESLLAESFAAALRLRAAVSDVTRRGDCASAPGGQEVQS